MKSALVQNLMKVFIGEKAEKARDDIKCLTTFGNGPFRMVNIPPRDA